MIFLKNGKNLSFGRIARITINPLSAGIVRRNKNIHISHLPDHAHVARLIEWQNKLDPDSEEYEMSKKVVSFLTARIRAKLKSDIENVYEKA